ncbi:hypothetical protein JXB02_05995 [Candidatus Woesearchaeota archaeon]|nr:hypothetical protein [Candidatus Woesearchaeota archaeon]
MRKLLIDKKAEMGVGTLIVFIAMLLVAAVAAGVLIQTAGSLQEKALSTGSQAKGQIATNARVVEVSATEGTDGEVDIFEQILKLAPGSNPIKLEEVIFTFNTYDSTATLRYAGTNSSFDNTLTGYNTYREEDVGYVNTTLWTQLSDDLDGDGEYDYVRINGVTSIQLNLSTYTSPLVENITIGNWTTVGTTAQGTVSFEDGGITYATAEVDAYIYNTGVVEANQTFNVTPVENFGVGFFAVQYLQQGSNFVAGNLQRGDVVRVYYEAPRPVGEDEEIRVNFIPKIGTPTLTQFVTPDVISVERVYLYP